MPPELKVQCPNCNSILMLTAEELRSGAVDCRFCGEHLRPTHDDPNCNFCRGEGFAVVNGVVWICELGIEI